MRPSVHIAPRVIALAAAAAFAAACSSTGPSGERALSLSLSTGAAGAPAPGVRASIQVDSGPGSLTIDQAQIVLARVVLVDSAGCAGVEEPDSSEMGGDSSHTGSAPMPDGGMDGGDGDCFHPLRTGPILVNLPVDGSTTTVLDTLVPPGVYRALFARLDAVRAGDSDDDNAAASAFLAAHPDLQGISVKVTGTFTDTAGAAHPFTFTVEADAEIVSFFNPPVTVGAGTSNLTMSANVAAWFTDSTGAVIDPTNPANAWRIERNIQRSFRTFEDDNHDGRDDHDGGDGGH